MRDYAVRSDYRLSWQACDPMNGWKNESKDQVVSDRDQEGRHWESHLEDPHDDRRVAYQETGTRKYSVVNYSTERMA